MEEFDLGPNGGLVYCMEYLLANFSWLEDKLKQLGSQYVLFDCPGQVSNTLPFQHEHHLSNVNSNLSKKKTTYISVETLSFQAKVLFFYCFSMHYFPSYFSSILPSYEHYICHVLLLPLCIYLTRRIFIFSVVLVRLSCTHIIRASKICSTA
jgi:Conserved hypothetical ATP binding protein